MSSYRPMASMMIRVALPILVICGLAPLAAAADANHLIITEFLVNTRTPYATFGSPFIEIANPTGADIDLSDVYLTDGTTVPSGLYYNLTLSDQEAANAGGGAGGDFNAKFPEGYVLAAGTSLAISLNGSSQYFDAYGQLPDFELFEDGGSPDDVPEMVEVFPGSINAGLGGSGNVPTLSENFESLVLFAWDGTSDLVQDLDYVVWGTQATVRVDKTDVTIGSSQYLPDTPVANQIPVGTSSIARGTGYRRLGIDEGLETLTGGNGIGGHDETSENLSATWQLVSFSTDGHEPPAAPASHYHTAPIVTNGENSPAVPFDGQAATLSVSATTAGTLTDVAIFVSIDGGSFGQLTEEEQDDGSWTAEVAGQSEGTVVRWYALITNSATGTATFPSAAPLYYASYTVGPVPEMTLLISEVCPLGENDEFIEIWNPKPTDVDMSDYYLTDSIHWDAGYWNIGLGATRDNIGGGAYADFHARFPDGYILAAGDTIVISVPGSTKFAGSFGFLPDLELFEDDLIADNVPDMQPVFTNSGTDNSIFGPDSAPTLSNAGEIVVLYHYVEGEDLVEDVDIFLWGTADSYKVYKSGISIGGSTYLSDTSKDNQDPYAGAAGYGQSYQRSDASEGNQITSGGNGITGGNETSEDWSNTFELLDADPSVPVEAESKGEGAVELVVKARTFMPTFGEIFPVQFISLPKSETKVRIFDLEGRLVVTLFDSRFHGTPSVIPGAYSAAVWDGRDSLYERVKAGMYIVHLSVVSFLTGEESTQTAPVVVATQLSK